MGGLGPRSRCPAARYAEFDGKRRRFMADVQNGRVKDAQLLGLAAPAGAGPGAGDRRGNLKGIALVLDNRPREAVNAFQQALQAAGNQPYEAVNLMLLLSDAQRRGGDSDAAAERTWLAAADLLTDLAAGPARIADPILLERAAYLRPANTPWPRPAQQRLCDVSIRQGIIFPALAPRRGAAANQRHGRSALVGRHRSLAAGPQRVAGGADRL